MKDKFSQVSFQSSVTPGSRNGEFTFANQLLYRVVSDAHVTRESSRYKFQILMFQSLVSIMKKEKIRKKCNNRKSTAASNRILVRIKDSGCSCRFRL